MTAIFGNQASQSCCSGGSNLCSNVLKMPRTPDTVGQIPSFEVVRVTTALNVIEVAEATVDSRHDAPQRPSVDTQNRGGLNQSTQQ